MPTRGKSANNAEEDARIGDADPDHDEIGDPARHPGPGGDDAQQQGAEQEPGRIVGEAAEGDRKLGDAERPEQEASHKPRQRVVHGPGDPGHHHEAHDGKRVLRDGLERGGGEPHDERNQNAQHLPDDDHP
jgi:hypothetical protein